MATRFSREIFLAGILLLLGCGGATPATTTSSRPQRNGPRLVISVIYDQLASWVLREHLPYLREDGAIKTAIRRGAHIERSSYPYSGTFTAPGHAFTYTGIPPYVSGVSSNRVWDRARHARVSTMDDASHAILGREDAFASPTVLRGDGVGEAVANARTHDAFSHTVVSLAMKDRSAILPAGHQPDAVFWFDARANGFTTSRYYTDVLPSWVVRFNAAHPLTDLQSWVWTPLTDVDMHGLGEDAQSGEGGYGWDAAFPHPVASATDSDALLAAPESTMWLFALAERAIEEMHLGEDDGADLLALSIASTDYVGHAYGPMSWEYRDNLVRVDAALGALIRSAEARTSVAVLITADHGIAPLVERAQEQGHEEATRFSSESMQAALENHLRARFARDVNDAAWIEAWVQPYVYFTEAVRTRADFAEILRVSQTFLEGQPGILSAVPVEQGPTLRASPNPVTSAMGLSIGTHAGGDLFVMPREWSVAVEDAGDNTGTAHGSSWSYDREVPVLIFGEQIHGTCAVHEVAWQGSVAPTLATLLNAPLSRGSGRGNDPSHVLERDGALSFRCEP